MELLLQVTWFLKCLSLNGTGAVNFDSEWSTLPEPYQLTSNKEGKVQLMLIHNLEKDYYGNPVDACYELILKLNELKMLWLWIKLNVLYRKMEL